MGRSRICRNGTTSALQPEEITSKGTSVSCVYYQSKSPCEKSLETYLMIPVLKTSEERTSSSFSADAEALSASVVEYSEYISAEEKDPHPDECPDMTLNYVMAKLKP